MVNNSFTGYRCLKNSCIDSIVFIVCIHCILVHCLILIVALNLRIYFLVVVELLMTEVFLGRDSTVLIAFKSLSHVLHSIFKIYLNYFTHV